MTRQWVAAGQTDHDGLGGDLQAADIRDVWYRRMDDDELHAASTQGRQILACGATAELEVDVGVAVPELLDHRFHHAAGQRRRYGDPQSATGSRAHGSHQSGR